MGYAAEQFKNAFPLFNPIWGRKDRGVSAYNEPKIVDFTQYIKQCEENIEEETSRPYMLKSMPLRTYTLPEHETIISYADLLSAPHTLVAGATGCGKSVLLHSVMYELMGTKTPKDAGLVLIDPKRVELVDYKNTPFCLCYTDDNEKAVDVLEDVCTLIEDRYTSMQQQGIKNWNGGKVFVVIDELADLLTDFKVGNKVKRLLQKILQIGRAAGISIIAATQAPSRKVLPAELTLNFTNKIALRCDTAIESRQVVGVKGAELLPKHGKGLYRSADGLKEIDVPFLSADILQERIDYWNAKR